MSERAKELSRLPTAGDLRYYVAFRTRTDAPGLGAGITPEYSEPGNAWGRLTPVGGATYRDGVQTGDGITHHLTVRWRAGIERMGPDWEAVHGDCVYRIKRVAPWQGRHDWLLIDLEQLR